MNFFGDGSLLAHAGRRMGVALAAAALLLPASEAFAQQRAPVERPSVLSAGGDPNTPDLELPTGSRFDLSAAEDVAYTGMRMSGTLMACTSNRGPYDVNYNPCFTGYMLTRGGWIHQFFDFALMVGTPRSTWTNHRDQIPSLNNIRNADGTSAYMNFQLINGTINFDGADGTLGVFHSGAPATNDGSCQDFTPTSQGQMTPGALLLAGSNCPPTWGAAGWQGSRPITSDDWESYRDAVGPDFSFDYWRVPEEFQRPGFLGNFQVFGRASDYYSEALDLFGEVVPGGAGAPVRDGYPLGLDFNFDAFNFNVPSVANTFFWQATIVNNSAEVYGTPINYDSLYIGFSPQPSNHGSVQASATYYEPHNGSIRWVNSGVNPGCNGGATPGGVSACLTGQNAGFFWGGTQTIVLKSPIGDLRNKHFSDPASPFFDLNHPNAGDTITFNHGHICGYGGCAANNLLGGSRRLFGLISSQQTHVLAGRTPDALDATQYWRTFHNADFPARGDFNRYVPGDWTYSNRPAGAPVGPDTLFLDSCLGAGAPTDACVVSFADTLPGGLNNRYGNVQTFSAGPFPLAAGDTTSFVIAITSTPDSITTEDIQANIISLYMNFWLSPQPPAPVQIVSSTVRPGSRNEAQVILTFDDTPQEWEDPFLMNYYNQLITAPAGTGLATLRDLNPWLPDAVLDAARNNLEALYVYKSCNGGTSFTSTASCIGNPATDEVGNPVGNGWRPAAILRATPDGSVPNTWTDNAVNPGISYLYSVSSLSRGATFTVLDEDPDGNIIPVQLEIAPSLLAPIATSTSEPNVALVYVPASIQSGGELATATVLPDGQGGTARVPFNPLVVRVAGEPAVEATYRVVFGSEFVVTETATSTTVEVTRGDAVETFSGPAGITTIHAGPGTTVTTTTNGATVTTLTGALGVVVVRQSDGAPLLVSTDLRADETTPGAFLARPDFPNFTLSVDATRAGQFSSQFYVSAAGDTLLARQQPSILWNRNVSAMIAPALVAGGEYVFGWQAQAYGPDSPFLIDFADPASTSAAVSASLNARAVAQTGSVSQEVFDEVHPVIVAQYSSAGFNQAARDLALTLTTADLVAVKLPFTIRNATHDRAVTAVMLDREVRARLDALAAGADPEGVEAAVDQANQITLGSGVNIQGGVTVPGDTWIPSDRLYFVESDDGELTVTWRTVSLECTEPRPSCNPVRGPGAGTYVSTSAGMQYVVRFFVPFTEESEFLVRVSPAVAGALVAAGDVDVSQVLVVPNPYLGTSRFEQAGSTDSRIYFVNMPPSGTVRIYSVGGFFVQQITWGPEDLTSVDFTLQGTERARASGDLAYNLRTREGNELASGLYLFVVESEGQKHIGKFVVVRASSQ